MFELIDLHTCDYDPSADVDPAEGDKTYVTTARLPAMDPMPDILVWGSRSFINTGLVNPDTQRRVYTEGFALAVLSVGPRPTIATGGASE